MRYFTDFIDGQGLSRDDEGLDFTDRHAACLSATEALVEAAHDLLRLKPNSSCAGRLADLCLAVQVRDESGSIVYRARLALELEGPHAAA